LLEFLKREGADKIPAVHDFFHLDDYGRNQHVGR
jgi:hypothetical protein